MSRSTSGPILLALVAIVGCGGSSPVSPESEAGERSPAGRVSGVVRFDGEAPTRRPLRALADTAGCLDPDAEAPLDEQVIVEDGRLADVVITLIGTAAAPPPPTEPLVIDQECCVFVPHVCAVQVGRQVKVANSDPIVHNVHLSAVRNEGQNQMIAPDGEVLTLPPLTAPEPLKLTCDLHPWMEAWILVVEHPWFAVSDRQGRFSIEGVPPGTWDVEAWHPHFGRLELESIRVDFQQGVEIEVVYGS